MVRVHSADRRERRMAAFGSSPPRTLILRLSLAALACLAALCAGCAAREVPPSHLRVSASIEPSHVSLSPEGDSVRITVRARNPSLRPVLVRIRPDKGSAGLSNDPALSYGNTWALHVERLDGPAGGGPSTKGLGGRDTIRFGALQSRRMDFILVVRDGVLDSWDRAPPPGVLLGRPSLPGTYRLQAGFGGNLAPPLLLRIDP